MENDKRIAGDEHKPFESRVFPRRRVHFLRQGHGVAFVHCPLLSLTSISNPRLARYAAIMHHSR